ncbi:MAG TPA: penicillin-binding protein 2 [Caulobacteraceae bacterium]|nr:penicillin-binding protein 2 [Caulobacteraceae bacterium]
MTPAAGVPNVLAPLWRWVSARLWWMEHAFERARASGRAEDDTRLRIFFVLALFGAGFFSLALGASKAALFSGLGHGVGYVQVAPNARADVTDRNGRVLAMDLVHYGLYLDPDEIADKKGTEAAILSVLPDVVPARIEKVLAGDKREYVEGGLTPEQKEKVHDLALAGVSFEEESARAYPLGEMAAHVLGFAGKDGQGLAGAEKALDAEIRQAAAKNQSVPLSIDLRVQGALQDELQHASEMHHAIGASGIVVNVRTGEILGLASYPSFDPNAAGTANPAAMVDHAAATVYEPGSVFKVFTLAMGIDAGVANVNTMLDARTPLALGGQTIHDYDKDNAMLPLWEVFTHSSNIGSARLGLMCGPDRMQRYFKSFGLLSAAPSELFESARPIVNRNFSENVVASMAFGHAISVSPLSVATGMSAILNGGIYRPLTIRPLAPGQAPAAGRRVIQASTSRTMLNLMRLNVTNGTGGKADIPGYRVGGKTGSAEKALGGHYVRNKLVSSFAAIFPTDGPLEEDRYLVLIMMDEPQGTAETGGFATGGWTAAPAAGRVIERIGPLLGVQRVLLPSDTGPKPPVDPRTLTGEEG